jgi:hypothetical protein
MILNDNFLLAQDKPAVEPKWHGRLSHAAPIPGEWMRTW